MYEGFAWQRGRRMCVWWKNYYVINSSGGIIKFSTLQAKEEEQLGELVFRIRKGGRYMRADMYVMLISMFPSCRGTGEHIYGGRQACRSLGES